MQENSGSGAAWLDYDLDGDLDLYMVNANNSPAGPFDQQWRNVLYRNNGDGTFTDVTDGTPLGDFSYGVAAAAADYDNDGDPDLYVTNIGPDKLFRNDRDRGWADVSEESGLTDPLWGNACSFFDYDRDGYLDLYVGRYLKYGLRCEQSASRMIDGRKVYYFERPDVHQILPGALFENQGNGTFRDVSETSKISEHAGYALATVVLDFDRDGYPDVYCANDMSPNILWRNIGDGTFENVALETGSGYGVSGNVQNGMGACAGDVNGDGLIDLVVSNHSQEPTALYINAGSGFFTESSARVGLLRLTFDPLTWAALLFDCDNDGDLDLFQACGHVFEDPAVLPPGSTHAQTDLLLVNDGTGHFTDLSGSSGEYFSIRTISRGASYADYDNDGDLDLLINIMNGQPILLRNDTSGGNGFLSLTLRGTLSNTDGIGAFITLSSQGRNQVREHRIMEGYVCSNDPRVHFGLGDADEVDRITIEWPSGTVQVLNQIPANQFLEVVEPTSSARPSDATTALDLARDLYQRQQHQEAESILRAALRDSPRDHRVWASLAAVLDRQGKQRDAIHAAARSIILQPNPKAYATLIQTYYDLDYDRMAEKLCETALRLFPEEPSLWLQRARLFRRSGIGRKAQQAYATCIQLASTEESILEEATHFLVTRGDTDLADEYVRALMEQRGASPTVRYLVGMLRYHQGRYEEAIEILLDLLPSGENVERIHLTLGECYLAAGDLASASEHLSSSMAHPATSGRANYLMAQVCRELGALDQAKNHMRQFLSEPDGGTERSNVEKAIYRFQNAINSLRSGNYAATITDCTALIAQYPQWGDVHYCLAAALLLSGSHDQAISQIHEAQSWAPFEADWLVNVGSASLEAGHDVLARACWEKCLILNPGRDEAMINLALLDRKTWSRVLPQPAADSPAPDWEQTVAELLHGRVGSGSPAVAGVARSSTPAETMVTFYTAIHSTLYRDRSHAVSALQTVEDRLGLGPHLAFYKMILLIRAGRSQEAGPLAQALEVDPLSPITVTPTEKQP